MSLLPDLLDDVISITPGICPRRLSKGAAKAEEAVCESIPGTSAPTLIVGKSTLGSGAMGRKK
jgi:hypothetical protein